MAEETEKYLKFKCPKCSHTVLEEVLTDVVQSSTCDFITEDGYVDYGVVSYDGGNLDRYQCMECGFVLKNGDDTVYSTVIDSEELAKWLKKNCPQDKE